ncbi:VOC family protein [Salibaculum sp.]|jgi:catechol 2,3-dioxygenase-like lactoylglutathione lyase family enzyme|uniref:VOC family protein n=1 Tax=Salibaculum sp. TaxID=2855480 RepID=UPI002B46AE54|nr:VOC family protein [Salibaculum sp.]HKL68896.1 VOC family protein [Salibaculum sp.]
MTITGVNHVTLSCTDLDRAVRFYRDRLGGVLRALWADGAYLELGTLWLCLARARSAAPATDYSHLALDVAPGGLAALRERLADLPRWQENRSEGESLYVLDPDGHRLELHEGDLASRLAHCRARPEKGVEIFDPPA